MSKLRGQDHEIANLDLRQRSIENVVPPAIQEEYPLFVEFMKGYFDYLNSTEGFSQLVNQLKTITDPDLVPELYLEALKQQYGAGFPATTAVDERLLIRVFEYWHRSKGTEEAIKAYFRIFLNTDAEVVYPKDSLLIVDGGNWDSDTERYLNTDSHIDETTMVLQDDVFYQTFSYLVKSGVSIRDWGATYEKLAHMAGWLYFGKVEINSLAQFEFDSYSPTIVPGFGVKDARLIILGAAAHSMGFSTHTILKTLKLIFVKTSGTHSLYDVAKNFTVSSYTPNDVGTYTIEEIMTGSREELVNTRRPAHIIITTS